MKKIYFLLSILCLSLFVFAGCGETTTNSETTTTNTSEDTNVENTTNISVSEEVIASVEEVHEHEFVYTANDDFTHSKSCKTCDEVNEVEDCTFDVIDTDNPMVCSICGFSHTHDEVLSAKDNEDGTHTFFCETCKNEFEVEEHIIIQIDNKEECEICSYERILWEEEPIEETIKYVKSSLNIRLKPSKDSDLVKKLSTNDEVKIIAHVKEYNGEKCDYYKIESGGFALGSYLVNEKVVIQTNPVANGWTPSSEQTFVYYEYSSRQSVDFGSFDGLLAEVVKVTGKSVEDLISEGAYYNYGKDLGIRYGKKVLVEIYNGEEHWGCPAYVIINSKGIITEFSGYFGDPNGGINDGSGFAKPCARYRIY